MSTTITYTPNPKSYQVYVTPEEGEIEGEPTLFATVTKDKRAKGKTGPTTWSVTIGSHRETISNLESAFNFVWGVIATEEMTRNLR